MDRRMDGWIRCAVGKDAWIDRWILKFALACLETLTTGVFSAKKTLEATVTRLQVFRFNDEHYDSDLFFFLLYFLPLCLFKKIKHHLSVLSVRKMDR